MNHRVLLRLILTLFSCLIGLSELVYAHEVRLPQRLDELSLKQISEHIYVVHGLQELPDRNNNGFISNSGVILTEAGVVIIDSGGSLQVGRLIVSKLAELTDLPVIAVINTHIHGDHWLGNAAIRGVFPQVPIYAHERAIGRLRSGEAERWREIFSTMTEEVIADSVIVIPDKALSGGESLEFGNTTVKLHHTGHAHTDSDLMVEVPASRVLFTGDIVEHGRLVSSDVPQDFNIVGQIAAIEYALRLPVDTYVPGHGASGNREIPQSALRFLQLLHSSVKRLYEEGLQDFEMRGQVAQDLTDYAHWFNFDQLGAMISQVYLQVEAADF